MSPRLKKTIFLVAVALVAALGVKVYMARLARLSSFSSVEEGASPEGITNPESTEEGGVTVDAQPVGDAFDETETEESESVGLDEKEIDANAENQTGPAGELPNGATSPEVTP